MRFFPSLTVLSAAMCLSSCIPLYDAQLFNDSGQDITVFQPGAVIEQFRGRDPASVPIPQGTAVTIQILTDQNGRGNHFSVASRTRTWHYSQYVSSLAAVAESLGEHRSLGARRVHVRLDSKGRIYLVSPATGQPIPQPPGFPLLPKNT